MTNNRKENKKRKNDRREKFARNSRGSLCVTEIAAWHVTLTAPFPRLAIVAVVGIPVIMNVKYVGSIKSVAMECRMSLQLLDRLHSCIPWKSLQREKLYFEIKRKYPSALNYMVSLFKFWIIYFFNVEENLPKSPLKIMLKRDILQNAKKKIIFFETKGKYFSIKICFFFINFELYIFIFNRKFRNL